MSAPAVAVPAAVAPPAPVRRLPPRSRRGGAPARPRLATGAAEHLTVTITIAAGDPEHRNRVLAALGDLIDAVAAAPTADGHAPSPPPAPVEPSRPGTASLVCLDPAPRTVTRDGRPIELSRREFDLLAFLVEHPRRVFSRAHLLRQVWGETRSAQRTVDVHVARLRRKVGSAVITTVRGVGYRLADDAAVTVPPNRPASRTGPSPTV